MRLRDARADAVYFRSITEQFEREYAIDEERLADESTVWSEPHVRAVAASDIVRYYWAAFSAGYSAGESREQLRARFDRIVAAAERAKRLAYELMPPTMVSTRFAASNKNMYRQLLWLVSVACALEVNDETFGRVSWAADFGWRDRLIDLLIASRRPEHRVAADLAAPNLVRRLGAAADAAPAKQQRLVKQHAAHWYSTWRGVYGWGDHEALPTPFYHGYWSFESAGFVRALGVDDSSFRGDEYYPADLLARP